MNAFLITGGLGVMGSLFARQLIGEGHRVIVMDDGTERRHRLNEPDGAEVYNWRLGLTENNPGIDGGVYPGDVSPQRLAIELAKVDYVIHAAASTGIPYSGQAPLDDWDRNVNGTLCLLEALRLCPKPTVILSSVKPYEVPTTGGIQRETMLRPDEPYAASKAAQSLMAQAWATSYGLPIIVLRCSNLYGTAAPHGPRHGWATWMSIQAALGMTLEVQGGGEQRRDLLFHTDLLDAIRKALACAVTFKGSILNIGGGPHNRISVNELVSYLGQLTPMMVRSGPGRNFEDPDVYVDNTDAASVLGNWTPKVSPSEGLKAIYDWATEHREALREVYREYL